MKKIISLLLALVMLIALGVPAFAETESTDSYYYAEGWDDLVRFFEEDLEEGDKVYIEVEPDSSGIIVYPKGGTACISEDNVVIVFKQVYFWFNYVPFFEITGDNVTIDFGGSELRSNQSSAVVVDGNDCTIKNAYFYYCEYPGGEGAGIHITNNDPGCRIMNCQFKNCHAECGGGIYIDSDDATIENCEFNGCKCDVKNGADVYDNEEESIVKNCKTTNTSAEAFYHLEEVQNCTFRWNGRSSVFSEGNIWIIAGVAVAVIAVAAVVIVKKKKKKAAAVETAEEAAETEEKEEK